MVKKRVDPRVKNLIEYNVKTNHRSLFILVGDHGKDQVENLHKILSKTRVKARPSVLWCYKKELGFSTHRKKRIKEIKRNQSRGLHDPDRDDPFDLFISSTNIRWTYYKETDKILGQTFGMCVLQDFEALTPNLLARTIETVEGGGIVIILLKTVKSLKQLYTLSMDVHSRFRTEAHHEIIPRFNERFILSLGDCMSCLVLDDELNILPISSKIDEYLPNIENIEDNDGSHVEEFDNYDLLTEDSPELKDLKESLSDTPNIGSLVSLTKTIDQANAVMSFLDAISEKTFKSTVALTAARGRGKSAAIGLCLAGAISYGFSNVFVTAPSPENLKTVFEFVISGLKILKYTEHLDFEVLYDHQGDLGKVVTRINVIRSHRQTIQYVLPSDHIKLAQAELVAIDEAAAIPLPVVKKLMGPYIVFLSSTINGYEGTGRALSLKLIQQLRTQQGHAMAEAAKSAGNAVTGSKSKKGERQVHEERWKVAADAAANYGKSNNGNNMRTLTELTLDIPIRYAPKDPIEKWLNNLLCLDTMSHSTRLVNVMPAPKDCDLYIVNRDALFSYHSLSETLLQKIWALYTAAHYKNTPNDLQMLSDAPAHRLFVLLGPQKVTNNANQLPDILCVIQVAFEGYISRQSIQSELLKGNKASGDMIPWTISQQFNDTEFATLSGARIVRIATHPDVQKMGYGSRAIDLLISYFQGECSLGSGPSPPVGNFGGEGVDNSTCLNQVSNMDEIISTSELLQESVKPRKKTPSLLLPISDRPNESLHWLGVSFGLTAQLLNFWTRKGFKTCYVRQTTNDLTGEHSCILLRELNCDHIPEAPTAGWVDAYVTDYRRRLISLMSYSFCQLETVLAITLIDPDRKLTSVTSNTSGSSNTAITTTTTTDNEEIDNDGNQQKSQSTNSHQIIYGGEILTSEELLKVHLSHHDMKRLELYSRNMVDHHMILDCLPILARLVFLCRLPNLRFSFLQVAILLATGLQHRDVDSIAKELDIPVSQVLAFFNKTIRKISSQLKEMIETQVSKELLAPKTLMNLENKAKNMGRNENMVTSLLEEQKQDKKEFYDKQKKSKKGNDGGDNKNLLLSHTEFSGHEVKANDIDLINTFENNIKKGNSRDNKGNIIGNLSVSVPASKLTNTPNHDLKRDRQEYSNDKHHSSSSHKKKNKNKHNHD